MPQQLVYEVDVLNDEDAMVWLLDATKYCSTHQLEIRLTDVVNENLVAQFRVEEIELPNITEVEEQQRLDDFMFYVGFSSWTTIVEDNFGKVIATIYDDYPSKTRSQVLNFCKEEVK